MNQLVLSLYIVLSQCFVESFAPNTLSSCRRRAANSSSRLLSAKEAVSSSSEVVCHDDEEVIANLKDKTLSGSTSPPSTINGTPNKRKLELSWCNHDGCYEAIRERVVGEHNHMELSSPATGQVVYRYSSTQSGSKRATTASIQGNAPTPPVVLLLVKHGEDELLEIAIEAIEQLTRMGVQVLADSVLREDLKKCDTIDSDMIGLFDPKKPAAGFGSGEELFDPSDGGGNAANGSTKENDTDAATSPDLIVTLGGDGLLMYAANVFSGPAPPILPIAGGSMGFLTPFAREEMLEAILISLGLMEVAEDDDLERGDSSSTSGPGLALSQRANNNMQIEATTRDGYNEKPSSSFGRNNQICISMRMRLDCRIFSADGSLKSRYAVLNEVVIDRGSSLYLASLECFCDDVHLTTVQADGIIFSTPTGSTAYSMSAGGSVVHPSVPAILVTPICPHVLSFRSMVFPDHVVLRCYVPSDARSATALVHFDGKHRTELHRGDSIQIQMSPHPVATINRADHSADWLGSLKRNFNFNTRVRQRPL